jgi:uncharacterized lipoprotein YddW (UPF0748 family)
MDKAQHQRSESSERPIVLSTPVTHTDWMWMCMDRIGHGPQSVRYILDRCKQLGWQRIYWRCFNGGRATYASKLADGVAVGRDGDNYHAWKDPGMDTLKFVKPYAEFDCLEEAVRYGHDIGIEVHAWISINEDDHAWGVVSRFSRKHPQYRWVKRSGWPYNSQLSFAFPQVREYKLGLLREILAYDIDGVFLDWVRTGDVRNEPQAMPDGTADFGYEKPLVDGFTQQFDIDPATIPNNDERWVRYRAEPQTLFMRDAHKLIKGKDASLPIAYMGYHSAGYRGATMLISGNLHGLLLDVEQWAQEQLIDDVVACGNYAPGSETNSQTAYEYMRDLVGDRCRVWLYEWVPENAAVFHECIKTAQRLGAPQILFWESDYVDLPERAADRDALTAAMVDYVTSTSGDTT